MIPKVIYMCHKQMNELKTHSENWKKLNPEYEIRLYDDAMCEEFLLQEFSEIHRETFRYIKNGPIKGDFWRLCIIYKYGGLYVDADVHPLVPLSKFIVDDVDFVTCEILPGHSFNPHFIMAPSGNKHLLACINDYVEDYNNKKPYSFQSWAILGKFDREFRKIKYTRVEEGLYLGDDGEKYQFLKNIYPPENQWLHEHAQWRGTKVLNNRYPFYHGHHFHKPQVVNNV